MAFSLEQLTNPTEILGEYTLTETTQEAMQNMLDKLRFHPTIMPATIEAFQQQAHDFEARIRLARARQASLPSQHECINLAGQVLALMQTGHTTATQAAHIFGLILEIPQQQAIQKRQNASMAA